ncbi:AAA family ATPase [uncultured Rhodospira sp.]|uniref:AAA family ATPase n=1 Tax=uncultured Rhodospira sp. TaxID=1936189 RepID=UPI00260ECC7F|nr:AAA family ATPase [uncultured Rhodospira sp.]
MKLLRAEFQNFRMLRDLELNFSSDPEKKLTVIRAANESGKTTILHGLQWALYGDAALPGKGEGFRLHPIDWNASEGKRVPITATVEFELTTYRRVSGDVRETRRRYRLVRSAFEDVDSQARRSASTVKLFALNETGASPIDAPEAVINDELPPELREVFFTDGDRALSFIEADVALSTKRERVQRAIRSLLGLGVIDDAIKHVRKSASEVNRKAKQVGSGSELNRIASRLEEMENDREKFEADLEDAKQQFGAFDEKVDDIDRKIAAALQKGDKEKLQKDLDQAKREIKRLDDQLATANKEHSALFRSRSIATDLLAPLLGRAFEKLEELHDQGKIPNTTIPVLQDRLSAEICICGETLESGDPGGEKRRAHIQKLIDDSQRADEIQEIITDLYYGAKPRQADGDSGSSVWLEEYKAVVERRDGLQTLRDEAGRKFRALEMQLDELPDTDIQGLRETRRQYKDQRDRHLSRQSSIETQLTGLRREREDLEANRDRLLREQKKGARILAELEVTQDVTKVLQSAYERITNEELHKVSELMNNIFIEMIGADPEQGAIIRHAEISREFDIIVYGPNDRTLNPDRDLNGASRRALTLAFILALTKVSEVEAPNVIDTPLGMTSGYVKRSILRTAVRESSQLVLFLTHDEIAGCEEIIDEAAGVVFTLTNPAHYPKMLVNDPGVAERKALRCECDHRSECQLCQRRADAQAELEMAS